jgi:hypothetical protein
MSSDRKRDWLFQGLLRLARNRDQARRRARRRDRRRRLRPRDSLTTLMLGTASAALAVVVFAVTLLGLLARTGARWHQPRSIGGVKTIYLPSPDTLGLGFLGMALGALGLLVSWRLRQLSWASAFGVALILLALGGAALYEMIVTLLN